MTTVKKFWLVHRMGCTPLPREHHTLESACYEAGQLAVKHPGESFVVLESKRACSVEGPALWVDCGAEAQDRA